MYLLTAAKLLSRAGASHYHYVYCADSVAMSDLKLALKITADLNNAKQQLQQFNDVVENSGETAKRAGHDWRAYAEQAGKLEQQKEAARAAAEAAAALEEQRAAIGRLLGEIDPLERKLARLDELEDRLNKAFKSGAVEAETYSEALAKINKQRDAISGTGIDTQQNSISKLLGTIDPLEKKLSKLDDLEQQLNAAFRAGRIESERYQSALNMLNQQREKAVSATNKTVTATDKNNKALKTSSRELSILSRQLMGGQFGSASSGLAMLAQRAGVLPPVLNGVGLAFSGVVAAGAGLYTIIRDINTEQDLLTRSIKITGNYAGITAGQVNTMAASFKTSQNTLAGNREILAGLNETGQFTSRTLESVGAAAISFSALTGKSATESVSHFARMKNNVTEWALETNRQYHFLDLATYQRITALEKQGRTEEAIELASQRFANAAKQRVNEMTQEVNWLNAALNRAGSAWDDMKNNAAVNTKSWLGLETDEDTAARLRAARQRQLVINQMGSVQGDTGWQRFNENDKAELQRLEKVIAARQEEAQEAAKVQQAQEKAIVAQKALNDVHERQKTDIDKQNEAIEKLIKNYRDLWASAGGREQLEAVGVTSADGQTFSGGQYDKDVRTVKDQYPDRLNQQYEQRLEQLKMETELSGQVTRASRVRYETEHGALKKLSVEQKKALITQAELADKSASSFKTSQQSIKASARENQRYVDRLIKKALKETETAATIREQEINARNLTAAQREQAVAAHETLLQHENVKKNLELQVSLFKLQGQAGAASALEIEDRYSKLFKELEAQSNTAGIALANMSKQLELDKLPLIDAQQQIERLQSEQSRREQLIQGEQQAGRLSNYEAAQKLLDVQRETRAELERQLPILEQAAQRTGDPAIIERLAAVRHEMQLLSIESNEWVTTLQSGVEGGLNAAFNGLITRSHDLSGALTAIAQNVVNSFANMASENLASVISSGIGNLFNSGADAAQETATAAAAAAQYSTAITTASSIGAGSMTTALTTGGTTAAGSIDVAFVTGSGTLTTALSTAFIAGAAQLSAAITSASAAGSIGGAAGGAGGAVAAASGGLIVGPGTGTSDSIPARLSNGEFVVKNAAVRRYGVNFMRAVNNMQLRGFADGGLVSPLQRPSSPTYSLSNAQSGQPQIVSPTIQQTLVIDPNEVLSSSMQTPDGQKTMFTFIRANRETLRQELGVN